MRKGQVHLRRFCVPFSQTDVTLPLRGSRYSLQLLVARSFFLLMNQLVLVLRERESLLDALAMMFSWLRFQRLRPWMAYNGPVRCKKRVHKLIHVRARTLFGGQRCATSRETSISVCPWTSVGRVRYDNVSGWLRFQRFLASGRPYGPSNVQRNVSASS